eukprot:GHVS01016413.1.p1 GENE.GHVS01016413.1~~GHVS01016413.1.p1  ORF type:complete len:119 (+),score=26.39 GHVS01016413.1:357-713(+)
MEVEQEGWREKKKERKRVRLEEAKGACEQETGEREDSHKQRCMAVEEAEELHMSSLAVQQLSQNLQKMFSSYQKECAMRWHSPKFRRIRDYWYVLSEQELRAARAAGRAYKVTRSTTP